MYYSNMFRLIYDMMAGMLGVLICATPLIFALLIRGDYSEAYYQMPILFLAMFFYSQCAYLGGIYVAYKSTKSVGITTTVAAICNLVVDIGLINSIGLYAASGSTLVSYLLLFVYRIIDIKKIVKLKYNAMHLVTVLIVLIVECGLCFMNSFVCNIINIILGITTFFVLNRRVITEIIKKIKKMRNTKINKL